MPRHADSTLKFNLTTFGCQMNFHDGERISGILAAAGWEEAPVPDEADAVIIVTCCVRQSAEDRFWGYLNSLKPLKKKRGTIFAVGGCVAQKQGSGVMERAPHVDLVFGTQQYPHIAGLLEAAARQPLCVLDMPGLELDGLPLSRREMFRAWVPVIYGCNNFCTYCVVPYTRGPEISRSRGEICREIGSLVEEGTLEVVLLGQNVSSYDSEGTGFSSLLSEVASLWPGVRIMFLTSHPRDFTPDIIEVMSEHKNICRYVHLPLQAGSDAILKAMGRGYDRSSYMATIDAVRDALPEAAISTDLMVGFPGESEDDFLATLDAARYCRYDQAYTFVYNTRPGTAAAEAGWPEVPHEAKMERFERLAALVKKMACRSNEADVGKVMDVLVEGESRKPSDSRLKGRSVTNKVVNFPGERRLIGTIAKVKITGAGTWSLAGEQE